MPKITETPPLERGTEEERNEDEDRHSFAWPAGDVHQAPFPHSDGTWKLFPGLVGRNFPHGLIGCRVSLILLSL
jgi:hypothetical protein